MSQENQEHFAKQGVSIVIPALNESQSILSTITACSDAICALSINFEIVIVDDGSTDGTGEIAKEAGVTLVCHPCNGGYGHALKSGILAASYDTIIITDADGTYPISDIPKLLQEYNKGFDMVVGARTGIHYKQSYFKSALRGILKFLVEWSSGRKIADINSGFRVFSRRECLKHYQHLCDSFSFTTSITLAYMMSGKFVSYIAIDYYPRVGASHVRLLRDSLRTLSYILKQLLYFDPLKIFILFACVWGVFGIAAFCFSAIFGVNIGYFLGILSFFGVFALFGMGLLAEQIRQLILSIRDKT